MVCLSFTFANAVMCLGWENELIRFPEITETLALFITGWDALPEALTGLLAAVTDHIGNDLACAPTHGGPKPTFLPVFLHKRPHLIYFEHIVCLGGQECVFKLWILLVFF